MPSILGFSRFQKRQLEELQTRLTIADEAVGTKTDREEYDNDMSDLDSEDEEHFNKIKELKEIKADKVEFNSRVNQLTQNDTLHEEQMNTLESNYANKVSEFEFDKIVAELKANDDSQDVRLDILEQQFADVQVRIIDEVKEKANELVKKTDFNAMISTLQHGDTGLHNNIIQLASKDSINNALTSYQSLLSNLQDKASYDIEINKLVQRNYDFEQRLLGIDQFFRTLAETYKLHRNGTEVIYTAEHQPGLVIAQKLFTAVGRRVGKVRISLTPYAYNSMTGTIGVVGSGKEVGQSGFNSLTRNGDIDLPNPVAFPIQIVLKTEGGTVLETVTLTQEQYLGPPGLTNYSAVNISYAESVINKNVGDNVSIPAPTESGSVDSYSVIGSNSLPGTLELNSKNGSITGTATESVSGRVVTIRATSVDGPTEYSDFNITFNIVNNRSFYNLFPENLNGTVIPSGSTGGYRTLIHTFTSGSAGIYDFFFSTLNNFTDVGEFITKVYKINTTSNMLLNATNINTTNIGITNGTVIFKDPFFTNLTNTSQFSLTLEANTQYFIECITALNDAGVDVGVSIENNGQTVSISGVSTNTETPEMNGDRSSLSFTTPISAPVRLAMMAPNKPGTPVLESQYILQNTSDITAIPNTATSQTFSTPISPVFNNVYYVNESGIRITSPIVLANGTLPAITTTPVLTGAVNVSFTPNIFPLSSAFGRVQKYNGASWVDDDFVQSINHNQPITFNGVDITGIEKLRVVISPTNNNLIRLPASQEFNLIERKFDPLWGKYIDGNVSSDDGTGGVAVDADGNVYLTGHIGDESTSLYDGSTQKPASGAGDGIYLIKYNANGVRQWTRYLDGAGNDRSYNVCCGGTYVYVVGNGGNGTTTNFPNITFPTVYGTKTSTTDGFIAAFGFDNSLGWFRWLAGSGVDTAYGVYTRPGNNSVVYVCGSSSNTTTTLDPSMGARPVSSDTAGFLIKLGSDGSFHWGRWIDASGEDACEDIVVDSSGNVYVAGYASGSDTSNTDTIFGSNSKPSTDMDSFIIKYNSSGVLQWGIWMGENVNDKYVDMYISNDNTIYLTGYTTRNGLRRTILDIIDTDGDVIAYNYLGGNASDEHYGNGVAVDSDGYIYLCGVSMSGSNIGVNSTYFPNTSNTGGKGFLIKFNNNMSIVGGIWLGNTGASATARFMTIDSNKNIIVAGNTIGSTTPWSDTSIANVLGNKPDTSRAGYVIKFDQALL